MQDLCCIELFSGTAGLTAALKQRGFLKSFGVDSARAKRPKSTVLRLNLLTKSAQDLVMQWLSNPAIFFLHAGPPCGTASRAREIRLSKFCRGPPPLRSRAHPDGIPGLAGAKWARLQSANLLYSFTAKVIKECLKKNIPFTIESPSRSRFWDTSFWQLVVDEYGDSLYIVDFQSCAFGGQRPKWTRLVSNRFEFTVLAKECPGNNAHLPWGYAPAGSAHTFSTAEEAEYPTGLCKAMSQVVLQLAQRAGHAAPASQHIIAPPAHSAAA